MNDITVLVKFGRTYMFEIMWPLKLCMTIESTNIQWSDVFCDTCLTVCGRS